MKDFQLIIKFMGGQLVKHPLAPKSSQSTYMDWSFKDGVYPTVATWAAESRMKFNKDWNLLMPVVKKIINEVEPFSEEGAFVITMRKKLMDVDIEEVYAYALHIITMINDAKIKKN